MKRELLLWFSKSSVSYPWRGECDPYKVWVSEIMLQQTQAQTVIPYYNKWIEMFPNIKSVAKSDLMDILKQWEGLGYYARARNFHRACKLVQSMFCGKIPNDHNFILLPGVGEYIDAAVRSICFNVPLPAIDANVKRIMSRFLQLPMVSVNDVRIATTYLAQKINKNAPGDSNQSLMDLGRFICKPKTPQCQLCPINKNCLSYKNRTIHLYPYKKQPKVKPRYELAVAVIWKNNKILVSKRKENAMLGGLWEFPGGKLEKNETRKNCVVREVKEELDINIQPYKHVKSIKHSYSHFSIIMHAFHCNLVDGTPQPIGCDQFKWIRKNELSSLPFPKANHKIFDSIPNIQP